MKIYWLCLFLTFSALAEVPLPRASTGVELGVARLSDSKSSATATSWMYIFDFQPDKYLSFFGQAGTAKAEDENMRLTTFNGGVQVYLLPQLGLQVGLSNSVIKTDEKSVNEMGPMAGLSFYVPVGVFKLGTSATFIRTQSMHSTALRAGLLISF